MNRAELISAVSDATALPRAQVDATLSAVLDQIVAATAAGQKTILTGFGSFQPLDRSARAGRNPATGEALQIPASRGVSFKAGATYKAQVAASLPAEKKKSAPAAKAAQASKPAAAHKAAAGTKPAAKKKASAKK
jgi:DNA-binding protein HU-beta